MRVWFPIFSTELPPNLGRLFAKSVSKSLSAYLGVVIIVHSDKRGSHVNTMTYSAFKSNIENALNAVLDSHQPVIVKKNRRSSVVVVSLDEYKSLVETRYLLSTHANAARLTTGIEEVEALIAQGK